MNSIYRHKLPLGFVSLLKNTFVGLNIIFAIIFFNAAKAQVAPTAVGKTKGEFNVDLIGRANYNVPLFVVPGTAGMQPELSISYNSGSGNGILGGGFSLNGFSSINRGGTHLGNSDAVRPVTYTSTDNFFLDGQLLVLLSGGPEVPGSEYRTEKETFSKIEYNSRSTIGGTGITGPFFTVNTKDGKVYSYGTSNDSKIEAQGNSTNNKIKTWALTSVTDRQGNYIKYSYLEDNAAGVYYPSRIDYTGNGIAGLQPYASVTFAYEVRLDNNTYSVIDTVANVNKRLKTISMFLGNTLVRSYNLTYDNAGIVNTSKLIAIQECGSDGTCLDATRFNWFVGGTPEVSSPIITNDNTPNSANNAIEWNNGSGTAPTTMADVNGDGREDMVAFGSAGVYVSLAGTKGNYGQPALKLGEFGSNQGWSANPRLVGDVNGDGLADIIGVKFVTASISSTLYSVTSNYIVSFASGSGNFSTPVPLNAGSLVFTYPLTYGPSGQPLSKSDYLLDVNGDGRKDIIAIRWNGMYVSLSNGNTFAPWKLASTYLSQANGFGRFTKAVLFGDLNGDGLPDATIFDVNYNIVSVSMAVGNGSFGAPFTGTNNLNGNRHTFSSTLPCHMGDVNGDGAKDIISFTNDGVFVALSKGNGTFYNGFLSIPRSRINISNQQVAPCFLKDMNGDGMADIVSFELNSVVIFLATGNGNFSNASAVSSNYKYADGWNSWNGLYNTKPTVLADADGNGTVDIIGFDRNVLKVSLAKDQKELVNEIIEGSSSSTSTYKINFKSLASDPSLYTKSTGAIYPMADVSFPITVVSSYSYDNGVGSKNAVSKVYNGYRFNLLRNEGAFKSITTMDSTLVTKSIVNYNNSDHYYFRMPISEYNYAGNVLSTYKQYFVNRLKYNKDSLFAGNIPVQARERWYPYYSDIWEYTYEASGVYVKYQTSQNILDSYGNDKQTVVRHSDGQATVTSNSITNNADSWLLGIVNSTQTDYYATGKPTLIRQKNFEYFPNSFLLKKETVHPGAALQLTNEYVYDNFGNVIVKKSTGSNGWSGTESRVDSFAFDLKGRWVNRRRNALGHVETSIGNEYFLTPQETSDINNLITRYTYDGFGRVKTITSPDNNVQTVAMDYGLAGPGMLPARAHYRIITTPAVGLPPTIDYYDVLDRKIKTERIGFNGTRVYTDEEYNAKGLVVRKSMDYYAGATPQWITMKHDIFGRVTSTTTPFKGSDSTIYYGLLTYYYAEGRYQLTSKTVDCLGRVLTSKDNGGNTITYEYNADGTLKSTTDVNGVATTFEYDLNGNKTYMLDPSTKRNYSYYNAFGELYRTQNNANQVTSYQLDKLGRVIYKAEPNSLYPALSYTYVYDVGTKAIGKLRSVTGTQGYTEFYEFDNMGRPVVSIYNGFKYTKTYDTYSRESTITYPYNLAIKNEYNTYNYLSSVKDVYSEQAYYTANTSNAFGQVTLFTLGNGVQTQRKYDEIGQLKFINSGLRGGYEVQYLEFWYNNIGTLAGRRDYRRNAQEIVSYDWGNRIQNVTLQDIYSNNSRPNLQMTYNKNGNITYKSDLGTYYYDQVRNAGPYAVTSTPAGTYSYDLNGNMSAGPGFSAAYAQFGLPISYAKANGQSYVYFHNADHSKYYEEFFLNGVRQKQNWFAGGLYELEVAGSTTNEKKHVSVNGQIIATLNHKWVNGAFASSEMVYLHHDNLGSVTETSNAAGIATESFSYDVWGKRRNPSNWTATGSFNTMPFYDLGYTGHESLDQLGLIDMKGRIYDPTLARFTSPDPFVQSPENTQSYNRYAYVMNNPLSNIDPTGYEGITIGGTYGTINFNYINTQISLPSYNNTSSFNYSLPPAYFGNSNTSTVRFGDNSTDYLNARTSESSVIYNPYSFGNLNLGNSTSFSQTGFSNSSLLPGNSLATFNINNIVNTSSSGSNSTSLTSFIPGVAAGTNSFNAYQQGNYLQAAGWGALAAADVGLTFTGVGAVAKGGAMLATRLAFGAAENRLLWYGLGEGGAALSKNYALANGYRTLNMTAIGRAYETVSPLVSRYSLGADRTVWNSLSASYARGARGLTPVLSGNAGILTSGRTFLNYELPNFSRSVKWQYVKP